MRILLSTTSFQDTPGRHHEILEKSGFEIVAARGPLNERQMLDLLKDGGGFDGLLNGDDALNARVIDAYVAAPQRLKVIAKYGIGLYSIDVKHATSLNIPVLFTPGVNETTVAEQTIGLMIALAKHFYPHIKRCPERRTLRKISRSMQRTRLPWISPPAAGSSRRLRRKRNDDVNVGGRGAAHARRAASTQVDGM